MNGDTITAFIQLLSKFDPPWVALIIAVTILCFKSPEIIKALRSKR